MALPTPSLCVLNFQGLIPRTRVSCSSVEISLCMNSLGIRWGKRGWCSAITPKWWKHSRLEQNWAWLVIKGHKDPWNLSLKFLSEPWDVKERNLYSHRNLDFYKVRKLPWKRLGVCAQLLEVVGSKPDIAACLHAETPRLASTAFTFTVEIIAPLTEQLQPGNCQYLRVDFPMWLELYRVVPRGWIGPSEAARVWVYTHLLWAIHYDKRAQLSFI